MTGPVTPTLPSLKILFIPPYSLAQAAVTGAGVRLRESDPTTSDKRIMSKNLRMSASSTNIGWFHSTASSTILLKQKITSVAYRSSRKANCESDIAPRLSRHNDWRTLEYNLKITGSTAIGLNLSIAVRNSIFLIKVAQ